MPRKGLRRGRQDEDTPDASSDEQQPVQRKLTMTAARRNAAVGAAMAAAQAVAPAAAQAIGPAAAATEHFPPYSRHMQTEDQAEAIRKLTTEFCRRWCMALPASTCV